jgi:hypothetical protein
MAPVTGSTAQTERGTIGLPRVPAGTSIQFGSPSNIVVKPLESPSSRQQPFGGISGRDLGLVAGAALAYYLLFRQPSSTATTPTTNTQKVPPASTYLPEPSELRQIGATSTTVIVATDPVPGAIRYDWYSYDNNLILARSPTEVAVINGLNPGTPYEIYVVAVGYGGSQSIPSSPLLVKTLPASPFVLVPAGTTGPAVPTGPTVSPTQPITSPTPTFPGLPTATGPSGVTTAPVVQPVQTSPTPAATAVFRLISAMVENMPVQPGQYAYASVTVQNIGDVPGGTTISGNTWNPNGNLAGTWSPESTGVIPPGQSVTITLRSSGLIASPYAIGTSTAPVTNLTATFTAASGGSVSTPLVIALPTVQRPSQSTTSSTTSTSTQQVQGVATSSNKYLNVSAGEQYTRTAGGVMVGGIFAPVGSSLYNALTGGGG